MPHEDDDLTIRWSDLTEELVISTWAFWAMYEIPEPQRCGFINRYTLALRDDTAFYAGMIQEGIFEPIPNQEV